MFNETASSADSAGAGLVAATRSGELTRGGGVFTIKCFDAEGNLKWEDSSHNLVVNEGLQDMNNKYFAGSTYTADLHLGLITGPGAGNSYSAGDTLATHAGWTEFTNYSGSRKQAIFGTASLADPSVISNSGSPAVFTITSTGGVVGGAFLCTVASGTSGILFSESNFQAPGDRTVVSGDVLNVTYSFSLDAV